MDDEDGTIVRAKCASNGGRLGVVNGAFVVSRDASGRVRAHATTEDGRLATMDVDALDARQGRVRRGVSRRVGKSDVRARGGARREVERRGDARGRVGGEI